MFSSLQLGNTPLPSWIKFSPENLTFTGVAPEVFSLVAPPQYFKMTIIASTHSGFTSASQSFNIVIGEHDLTIDPVTDTVNASIGGSLTYNFPLDFIHLDGKV